MTDHQQPPTLASERGLTVADLRREQNEVRHNNDSARRPPNVKPAVHKLAELVAGR